MPTFRVDLEAHLEASLSALRAENADLKDELRQIAAWAYCNMAKECPGDWLELDSLIDKILKKYDTGKNRDWFLSQLNLPSPQKSTNQCGYKSHADDCDCGGMGGDR